MILSDKEPLIAGMRSAPPATWLLLIALPAVLGFSLARGDAPSRYPKFDWDTVPIAFHFGDSDALMTPEQAAFVASKSNFICLEKGHGVGQLGDTESGIEQEARQLKRFNPDMKVIFYWNTFLDYSMFAAHEDYGRHPEWWLRTLDGELDLKNGRMRRYDLSKPEVRDWWTDVAHEAVVNGSTDGVFMDAFPQVKSEANRKLWGEKKYAAIQQGLADIVQETRDKLGEDHLMVVNGIRSTPTWSSGFDFPEHVDAAMIEHFGFFNSSTKESMLQDIREMEQAGKAGKMVVLKGWAGFTFIDREAMAKPLDEKRTIAKRSLNFSLAAFLAGAQENCYFIYNWGYRMHNGCLEWYPEFDRPLGPPQGDMVQEGWELSRKYEHASVWVNLETRESEISWH